MAKKIINTNMTVILLIVAGFAAYSMLANAGSLEPPASPGPTMKTLDEVEPRIPIGQDDIPRIIKQSGSYYLTSDVNVDPCAPYDAITINVNDVTIDLMGYSIIGPGIGAGNYSGISTDNRTNVEIRNGTVRNFGDYGIYANGNNLIGHRVIAVRAVSNGYGIKLWGKGHLIKDCTVADNTIGDGIYADSGSTITGNTAYNNHFAGIYAGVGCTVTGNMAYYNQGTGIKVGGGCTVAGNTVYNNQGSGIWVNVACTVTGNTARNNNQNDSAFAAGILVYGDCLIKGNTLNGNLQNNISVMLTGNAIEENLVTDCVAGNGIRFAIAGNFYANNRASGNGTDYANTAGNTDGGGNASF